MSIKLQVGDRVRVIHGDRDYGLYNGSEHEVVRVSDQANTVQVSGTPSLFWLNETRFQLIAEAAPAVPVVSVQEKIQIKIDAKIEELATLKAAYRTAQKELSKMQEVKTFVAALEEQA